PAVIQGERQVSFRDFRRRVDTLAGGLLRLGIGQGDRICVLAQNDPAYLELYGACARQSIIAYPINWRLTAQEVERVVERAAPKMMVADASTLPVVGEWPRTQRAIAHWYQLGDAPAEGFQALSSLYREGVAPAAASRTSRTSPPCWPISWTRRRSSAASCRASRTSRVSTRRRPSSACTPRLRPSSGRASASPRPVGSSASSACATSPAPPASP